MSDDEVLRNLAAALGADVDQLAGSVRDIARVAGAYRKQLIEEGFDPGDAAGMAVDWQERFWSQLHDPIGDDGDE